MSQTRTRRCNCGTASDSHGAMNPPTTRKRDELAVGSKDETPPHSKRSWKEPPVLSDRHAHKLHPVWMVSRPKEKRKKKVKFANWKFGHSHAEVSEKRLNLQQLQKVLFGGWPPRLSRNPHIKWRQWLAQIRPPCVAGDRPLALNLPLGTGPSRKEKKEKKKKFPLSCRLTLNQFTFHTAAAWGGGWIRLLTRPHKRKSLFKVLKSRRSHVIIRPTVAPVHCQWMESNLLAYYRQHMCAQEDTGTLSCTLHLACTHAKQPLALCVFPKANHTRGC